MPIKVMQDFILGAQTLAAGYREEYRLASPNYGCILERSATLGIAERQLAAYEIERCQQLIQSPPQELVEDINRLFQEWSYHQHISYVQQLGRSSDGPTLGVYALDVYRKMSEPIINRWGIKTSDYGAQLDNSGKIILFQEGDEMIPRAQLIKPAIVSAVVHGVVVMDHVETPLITTSSFERLEEYPELRPHPLVEKHFGAIEAWLMMFNSFPFMIEEVHRVMVGYPLAINAAIA